MTDLSELDPHRPYVDDVTLPCPHCAATAARVPEVIDGWYDSRRHAVRPVGLPAPGVEEFAARYPADFICEAIDQTRGWFYTLMAVGTLVFDQSSYRNVLCLGHILDERGPQDEQAPGQRPRADPADGRARRRRRPLVHAGRRLAVAGPPRRPRRDRRRRPQDAAHVLEHGVVPVAVRPDRRLVTADPATAPAVTDRPVLDRWALSEANRLARDVDEPPWTRSTPSAPGGCWPATSTTCPTGTCAARDGGSGRATRPRWHTLHECLRIVTLLMAPFTPFLTERVWQDLFATASRTASRSTCRTGRTRLRPLVTPSSPSRWPWSAAWSSWAAAPGPSPACAPGSRWPARWSLRPAGPTLPAELRAAGGRRAQRR